MFDAIVLAGGRGSRLGGADKPGLRVGTSSLLDRVLAGVADAARIVVVGPPRADLAASVIVCREEPPGSGPVAAIAAGLDATTADVIVVLAADLPWVAPAVPVLLDALRGHDVAVLESRGRLNYLAAAWRRPALSAALARVGGPAGAAVRTLFADVEAESVTDSVGWGRDCDSWADLAEARQAVERTRR